MMDSSLFFGRDGNVFFKENPEKVFIEDAFIVGEWLVRPSLVLLLLRAYLDSGEMAMAVLVQIADKGSAIKEEVYVGYDPINSGDRVENVRVEEDRIYFNITRENIFILEFSEKKRWLLPRFPYYSLVLYLPHFVFPRRRHLIAKMVR